MKKILLMMLSILFIFSLISCDEEEVNVEPKKEFLIENEDYIDLSQTYDGESFLYNENIWYMNKLDKVPLPDPYVYVEDNTYYIFGTSDRNNDVIDCYVTQDFVNFEEHFELYNPSYYDGWEGDNPDIYAPELYNIDGQYYLYYSANNKDNIRYNSVLVSNNPLGPFKPIINDEVNGLEAPLFYNKDYPNRGLDATVFTDDDNNLYIYYVVTGETQHIVGMKLLSPYQADWSTYTELVKPGYLDSISEERPLEWEIYRNSKIKIAEAPFMLKSNGKYYMTYSVNGCWNKYYNVCYAVSDSPLGNFVKPYEEGKTWTNLLLGYPSDKDSIIFDQWKGFSSGTAHHCFFKSGNQLMIGYHGHKNRHWNDERYTQRYFAFDYVYFDENGVPFCNGPTYSIQPLPESITGLKNIMSNATITTTNVDNFNGINDNYIVDCYNLENDLEEVVLKDGVSKINIEFDKEYTIYAIIIYNSAFYDKLIYETEYIDFGNGNKINYPQYCLDFYVNDDKEFVFPNSAINIEIIKPFKANKAEISFILPDGGNINEIIILGK